MLDKKLIVVVHEPKDIDGKILFAKAMRISLTGNIYYRTANPPLTVFDTDIQAAFDSEAGTKTTPPENTVKQRDGFVGTMDGDIESYRLACQSLVNAATSEILAGQIADSFHMELKSFHSHGDRQDELLPGDLPNSMLYRMKGTGPHEVETSPDNGATIIPLGGTRKGEKQIEGLILKQTMYYRNRQILTHDKYSAWTNWLPFTPTK
jgi:hypothetical protein